MIGISPQYGVYTAAYGAIIYSFLGNEYYNNDNNKFINK
jgi:MFS superfamily sulfate permease-like transporter